jgi:hypothetical protein
MEDRPALIAGRWFQDAEGTPRISARPAPCGDSTSDSTQDNRKIKKLRIDLTLATEVA